MIFSIVYMIFILVSSDKIFYWQLNSILEPFVKIWQISKEAFWETLDSLIQTKIVAFEKYEITKTCSAEENQLTVFFMVLFMETTYFETVFEERVTGKVILFSTEPDGSTD